MNAHTSHASSAWADSHIEGLTPQQQERLASLLDDCAAHWDRGECVDRELLRQDHPDLAEHLDEYVDGLAYLHGAAVGFQPIGAHEFGEEQRIGDFELLQEIGRGGMGVVFEARQRSLDRRVALKVLPFATLLSGKQVARFQNESQAAARLNHPHIAPVYAVGSEPGLHYFAMRLIDGRGLDEQIDAWKESRVDVGQERFRRIASWGVQAADALHAAHELSIVHRDIKPSNLMVDAKDNLWVMDFGLARFPIESDLTRTGDVIGTMRYMSPEQASGARQLDHRTDIYSLGATLYELLALRSAIRGNEPATIIRQLERERPYRLRSFDPRIPRDLETIVQKAMQASPQDRYATAGALRDDLSRFLLGQPIQARRPSLGDRMWKAVQRRKRLAAAITVALLAALVALSAGLLTMRDKEAKLQTALDKAKASQRSFERQLMVNYNHLALMQHRLGANEEAEANWRSAIRLYEAISRPDGESRGSNAQAALRMEYATACGNLGWALSQEDPEEALTWNQRALSALEPLLQTARPDDARAELARHVGNYGALLRRQGKGREAIAALARSVELYTMALQNGQSLESELAVSLSNLAMAESSEGDTQQAIERLGRALSILEGATAQPSSSPLASQQASLHHNLGMIFSRQSNWTMAFRHLSRAIVLQQEAKRRAPDSQRCRQLLSKHYASYSQTLTAAKRFDEAGEMVLRRTSLWPLDSARLRAGAEELLALADAGSNPRWRDAAAILTREADLLDGAGALRDAAPGTR